MTAFDTALAAVLAEEGGFVNDARDPGGMTCCGVTKATWERWCGHTASEADMRALTPAKVSPLYRAQYWNALHCDSLPGALALCVFDFGVNAGVSRAGRMLQQLVSATQDGVIGPKTLTAVKQCVAELGVPELVRRYQNMRRGYYRNLSTFAHFGKGWLARCDRIETAALKMGA